MLRGRIPSACNGVQNSSYSVFRKRQVACAHGGLDERIYLPAMLLGFSLGALRTVIGTHMLLCAQCFALTTAKQSTAFSRHKACAVFAFWLDNSTAVFAAPPDQPCARVLTVQDCLSGDGKALMFVNLSPTAASANETVCSLRFANQVIPFE